MTPTSGTTKVDPVPPVRAQTLLRAPNHNKRGPSRRLCGAGPGPPVGRSGDEGKQRRRKSTRPLSPRQTVFEPFLAVRKADLEILSSRASGLFHRRTRAFIKFLPENRFSVAGKDFD